MRTRTPSPPVVLAGIPTPDWTALRVEACAEVRATVGAHVTIGRCDDGALLVDLEAHGLRHVGDMASGGATFECDDADAIRSLAGALLGALAAAERAGVIDRPAPVPGVP